ncbi:hypothetical protein BV22DRAFT_291492 [Leucogyrophana mollusca]|uniref:Uncharacterized protein n=1 Tax=Leucogyrophana mollusca TaxID=85980 RepID=A0ACB8BNU2_9AGAM|nr:hypothetical protein BV22DRAFT_291492 [Leucogyrophana mollusca]
MEAEILEDARILQVSRLCQLAAAVVVIYDHVLTFHDEVDFIWKRPSSLVTILYFWNRYVGDAIIIIIAILFCSTSFSPEMTLLDSVATFCSNFKRGDRSRQFGLHRVAIMQLRIYAMYQKSKKILAVTAVCFVMEIAAISAVLATHFDHTLSYTTEPIPGVHMCATSAIGKAFTAIYIPIFSFELLLFVLAITVVFKHLSHTPHVPGLRRLQTTMRMLARYSTIYFFVETAGCAIATGMYLGLPPVYIEVANAFLVPITVILGSRFVLNTRSFYSSPQFGEDDSTALGSISFAQHSGMVEMTTFTRGGETQS